MKRQAKSLLFVLVCMASLVVLPAAKAQNVNLIANGDFSAGLAGWTIVPAGETPPWPLANGGANLHPVVNSGYTGTVIYQNLSVTGVGGKSYSFSMKLLKTGTPDDSWRTVAVYLTYMYSGNPVRHKLANPLNSEIATPVSQEGIPTFTGTVTASVTLPYTASAITKIEIAKENAGDFTVDDITLMEGAAPSACAYQLDKPGSPLGRAVPLAPRAFLGPGAGVTTLEVTASGPTCSWTASVVPGADWLTISGGASGAGNGQIQVAATANPNSNGAARRATISLGGQNFDILQLATPLARSVVSLGALNSRRAGNHTATLLTDGKVLIAGGHTNIGTRDALATAELYDPATRTFTPTGTMKAPRWGHTATPLPDGKVLIAGGYNYQGGVHTNLDTAELYDPATGQFTLLSSRMSSPRRQHTATAFPDPITHAMKVLIAGGIASGGAEDNWSVTNRADIYDVALQTFTPTGNLVTGRGTHRAVVVPGPPRTVNLPAGPVTIPVNDVLIAGGSNYTDYLASAEIYDATTGTFSSTGSMAAGRAHGIGNLYNVFGGGVTNGQAWLASTEFFDPSTGAFYPYASLNQARRGHAVAQLSLGRFLVSGGAHAGNPTMEILDLATDTFTPVTTPMTTARVFHTATTLFTGEPEVDVLIVGGDVNGTAELFTVATAPPANVTLTVAKEGTGVGTVTSAPAGISCGAACNHSFNAGTQVTLTATPASGSVFSGWSGGGCSGTGACTVTLNGNTVVTAAFYPPTTAVLGPDRVVFDRVVLDAGASQGNIVSYAWTLTHRTNAAYNRTATGKTPNLTDLQPGFYDVTLTVTDAASQSKTATNLLAVAGPWDVDGDSKSGLAEVIWLLQAIAGKRN
ncbi:MAG: kelch repeat-containing protein [Pseudomonadota bacterium]|nr:kelch repeat-containing protein [Pseudomonadota bacterium]